MSQLYRDQFAHYINTATSGSSKNWELEGIGVEALSIQFNPQVSQYKTIIKRLADSSFDGYQMQSSVSGKRIDSSDPIYQYLDTCRREAKAVETDLLEVDMANTSGTDTYVATQYKVLIVINEFLGENATISYDMYIKDPVQGTVTISSGDPTFTPAS